MSKDFIRNFAIIAHIDHGKSTLADRLLELTGTVEHRKMQEQLLDSNPIERERGITIKLAPVRMTYRYHSGNRHEINKNPQIFATNLQQSGDVTASLEKDYIINLIDTPGHVDFSYEVSRSLAACEGAVLVVDATQGVQAQTLANLHQAQVNSLKIIPVINKIDLPNARVQETIRELCDLGFQDSEIIQISAKTGLHVEKVLDAIVERVPAPGGDPDKPLRALIFSSQYDSHKGVIILVRVVDGSYRFDTKNDLRFLASDAIVTPVEIGYFIPYMKKSAVLGAGEVGFIATGLKDIRLAKVGDTITQTRIINDSYKLADDQTKNFTHPMSDVKALPGYKEPKPMVFLGLFPLASDEYQGARDAVEKLRLSDSAFTFRPISSMALGNGFHCGFLGLLHAEIVQERLVREFGLTLLATAPSVEYLITLKKGISPAKVGIVESRIVSQIDDRTTVSIQSATEFCDPSYIEIVKEPLMQIDIYTPRKYVGGIMQICQEKRGEYVDLVFTGEQGHFTYLMPLSEMIVDFFDRLKSISEGYASLDYEFFDYQPVEVVKMDILVNKEKVDAFSILVVKNQAQEKGRRLVERLSEVIPRQQFVIPIQASIGGTVIARSDVKAFRKDVTAKLYGGDRSRKDKLLDKQKKGKARMKMVGKVEIPQSAFFEVLRK